MPSTPFHQLGGAEKVRAIVERFYAIMHEREPALTALHPQEPDGRVERAMRERFAMFLVGWLGGPDEYVLHHGHPRLRMRHGRVAVNLAMRDAWLRSMAAALDEERVSGDVRRFLDGRFAEVADFLRNAEG
jgi:hemoglobin